ncbi:MAG TPA: serine/threonine-protein kinase [Polyangium sp.]|nr:serine/threonine-protein kinase [Polyangium sp.]
MRPTRRETVAAFAATLAGEAAQHTFRPPELNGKISAFAVTQLPRATMSHVSNASPDDTAVFLARTSTPPASQSPSNEGEAYEIVSELGRGGMGEVWRAVQRSLGREIALKRLATDNATAASYFVSEARVTARLSHANIVPVHALGLAPDGRPMLAMKLVEGRSWAELLQAEGENRSLERHLQIFLNVCNAVEFAHSRGFLHRDLKPANVMIGEFGQVFVVDWGLAVGLDRRTCDENGILHVQDVRSPAGTPTYMAPELALGYGDEQGPATDVYLLGACLHEIVTGSPPHVADNIRDVLDRAVASAPPNYSEEIPEEIISICRRAMAKAPTDRYPDIRSLRLAVEAFLSHEAAREITRKGERAAVRLDELIASFATIHRDDPEAEENLHKAFTEARFAFEMALESWPENEEAKQRLSGVLRAMLIHAINSEDVALASRLAAEVDDADLRAKLEALRGRISAREKEFSALREHAELLDDARIARPLGNVFVVAGITGALATIPTRMALDRGKTSALLPITVLWLSFAAITCGYAFFVLRRAKKSLVSPRVGFTWAAVGASCLLGGAMAIARGDVPFQNASYTVLMIAIGFVSHAMQSRKWLLLPAGIMFVGAVAIGLLPDKRIEIFGLVWLIALIGVGVVLRKTGDS